MSLNEIRSKFLDFFESKDHLVHASYSLVPQSDKSLLLINSGMAPIKNYFTGAEKRPHSRMATCQKCIRTGDIENVGHTSRHATFFEMLGNFSFGDYFKKESIAWGWEFVTEWLEMPLENLWVTVYLEDDEAAEIWEQQQHVPKERIVRLGKKDNFWEIGTGPCGPCSEIYYDRGVENGCGCDDCAPGCDCDRFVEFWNHVFTQFDRDEAGVYNLLDKPNIDTGMGLERVACLVQGVNSIFEIDTFRVILDAVCAKAIVVYGSDPKKDISIRIITDHIRAVTFMVGDGILPNNEGRGYVLRRLLRRAARHGKLLGIKDSFLFELVNQVIEVSSEAYPELLEKEAYIKKVISVEEDRFELTLDQGLEILKQYTVELTNIGSSVLTGEMAFKLYDTFGFPIDLTRELLEEKQMTLDESGFSDEMEKQKERARSARNSHATVGWKDDIINVDHLAVHSQFVGYQDMVSDSVVLALYGTEGLLEFAKAGDDIRIVLDETPFYAESGGQVGDSGTLIGDGFVIDIKDTQKGLQNVFVHHGVVIEGTVQNGAKVKASVTRNERLDIMRNHTATHLLHQALKDIVGDHVNQAGSQVSGTSLRFDFTHFQGMTSDELTQVEWRVNQKILEAIPVDKSVMGIQEARDKGAMALFGEKYGDTVRVITVGSYSIELCGGTHVDNTGTIGLFKILSEGGVAAGVRRIEAVTGKGVYDLLNGLDQQVAHVAGILKTSKQEIEHKASHLVAEYKQLQKEMETLKQKQANNALDQLLESAQIIGGVHVVVGQFENLDLAVLRNLGDQIKQKLSCSVSVLGLKADDKLTFLAMADDAAIEKGIHCGNLVKAVSKIAGGSGGGKPNMAQAGAPHVSKLDEALKEVYSLIEIK
jgi:alanyl-tRNA synthetase